MDQLSTRFILYLKIIYRKIKKHYSSFIYIASCYIKTISLFVRSLYQNHKMSLAVSGDNWAKPYPYWIFLQIVALIQLLQVTQKCPGFREFDWVHFCIFYCLSCNMRKWVSDISNSLIASLVPTSAIASSKSSLYEAILIVRAHANIHEQNVSKFAVKRTCL